MGAFRADLQFGKGHSFDVVVHWLEEARVLNLRTDAAVPEPSTASLVFGTLLALAVARTRRRSMGRSRREPATGA